MIHCSSMELNCLVQASGSVKLPSEKLRTPPELLGDGEPRDPCSGWLLVGGWLLTMLSNHGLWLVVGYELVGVY